MLHSLFDWIQSVPGAIDGDPATSWSAQFAGSLNLWAITEAAHLTSLLLFAGAIFIVDFRMMGWVLKDTPYSAVHDRVLPLTVIGFGIAIFTGVLLFLSNPVHYYHSVWFRVKVIFLFVAAANIAWFHLRTLKTLPEWDTAPKPPPTVRIAAALSLASWAIVIVFGRLIALSVFNCEALQEGTFLYGFAECASEFGLVASLGAGQ
jgi:hypothetical protein